MVLDLAAFSSITLDLARDRTTTAQRGHSIRYGFPLRTFPFDSGTTFYFQLTMSPLSEGRNPAVRVRRSGSAGVRRTANAEERALTTLVTQLSAENEVPGCPAGVDSGAGDVAVVQINEATGEITYRVVASNLPATLAGPSTGAHIMSKTRIHQRVQWVPSCCTSSAPASTLAL
jgi:hypothetical protein